MDATTDVKSTEHANPEYDEMFLLYGGLRRTAAGSWFHDHKVSKYADMSAPVDFPSETPLAKHAHVGNVYRFNGRFTETGSLRYDQNQFNYVRTDATSSRLKAAHDAADLLRRNETASTADWRACLDPVRAAYRAATGRHRAVILARAVEYITGGGK